MSTRRVYGHYGSRGVRHVEGPRGGQATVVRGPRGRTVGRVEGPRGGTAIGVRGPHGRAGVAHLPSGSTHVRVHGHSYYRHGYRYYRPYYYGGRLAYFRIGAPVGVVITTLPEEYTLVVINGRTYYVHDGDYYTTEVREGKTVYVVVENPTADQVAQVISEGPSAPDPFQLVRQMSDYLGKQEKFTVIVNDTFDEVTDTDSVVQLSSQRTVYVSRPDMLAVRYEGGGERRRVLYDGKTLTILNITKDFYAKAKMPPTIDDMLDTVAKEYGLALPLADLLYSSPSDALVAGTRTGQYVGQQLVGTTLCHHLAFTKDDVDWELWIQKDETKPLPRKLVITYKNEPAKPRYTMIPEKWEMGEVPANAFELEIPDDASEIEMMPLEPADDVATKPEEP